MESVGIIGRRVEISGKGHINARSRSSGGCQVGARREPAYFRRGPITAAVITHAEHEEKSLLGEGMKSSSAPEKLKRRLLRSAIWRISLPSIVLLIEFVCLGCRFSCISLVIKDRRDEMILRKNEFALVLLRYQCTCSWSARASSSSYEKASFTAQTISTFFPFHPQLF